MSEQEATLEDFAEGEGSSSTDEKNLPAQWREVSIIDLCEIGGGSTPKKSNPVYWEGGDILWTTPKDFDGPRLFETENKITKKGAEESTSKIYPPGTTLMVVRSGVLRHTLPIMIAERRTSVNQDLKALEPYTHEINPEYFFQALSGLSEDIRGSCKKTGTTVESIQTNVLEQYPVPVPPLEEQRKIASVLYTVDQAIQKTDEIIEQTERIQKGLRQDLFTFGIDESGEIRTDNQCQETYLGNIPEQWKLRRIDKVCSETVDCPHSTPEYTDEGILVVRTSEIEDGRFDPSEAPRVTEEGYKKRISRLEPQPGDVIFTREAPIGEAFKIPEGMKLCLGQRIMQLRPKDGVVDPDFLVELIYSDMMQSWFERSARGSTSKHVNVGDIEGLKIPIPSLEEQKRIDSVLGNYREQIDTERIYLNRLQRLERGLMQDLLSGEVRTHDKDIELIDDVLQHG